MLKKILTALLCLSLAASMAAAHAAKDAPPAAQQMTVEQFIAALNFQKGKITLPGGLATLDLPANFRYLSPSDTERVLVDAWGNPPNAQTLGMIVPAAISPLETDGWGVIVTYARRRQGSSSSLGARAR